MGESAVTSAHFREAKAPIRTKLSKNRGSGASTGFRAKAISGQAARLFASFFVLFSFKKRKKNIVSPFSKEFVGKISGDTQKQNFMRKP